MTDRTPLQQQALRLYSELKIAARYASNLKYEPGGEYIGDSVYSDIGECMNQLEPLIHPDDREG